MMSEAWAFDSFEGRLGHRFTERALLREALSHDSLRGTDPTARTNRRLAFLGDAVLGLVVGEMLFDEQRAATQGTLTEARKSLVSNDRLARIAKKLELPLEAQGVTASDQMLATAVEAVLGAVYRDAEIVKASQVARRLLALSA